MRQEIEGRICLISIFILTTSIYLTQSVKLMIFTVIFSALLTRGYSLKILKVLLPLFVFFLVSIFVYPEAWKLLLLFASIVSAGSLVFASSTSQISSALIYFRVPEKFVSTVSLSLNFLQLLLWDLENLKDLRLKLFKLLKILSSLAFLRSIGLAEALYSKCYNYRVFYQKRMPKIEDLSALLTILIAIYFSLML